jgi:peroxiredoxin
MKKLFAILMAVMLLAAFGGNVIAEEEAGPAKVGDAVPDFTLKDALSGEDVNFGKDIKGGKKITALIFMNTGCSACLAEIREINDFITEEKDGGNINAYAIAVDARGEAVVKGYNERYQFKVNYLLDPDFTLPPVFGFSYTPALVVIDKDGKIVATQGGYNPARDKGKIKELFKKHG